MKHFFPVLGKSSPKLANTAVMVTSYSASPLKGRLRLCLYWMQLYGGGPTVFPRIVKHSLLYPFLFCGVPFSLWSYVYSSSPLLLLKTSLGIPPPSWSHQLLCSLSNRTLLPRPESYIYKRPRPTFEIALHWNLNLNIPRKGIVFMCLWASKYSHFRPTYFPAAE